MIIFAAVVIFSMVKFLDPTTGRGAARGIFGGATGEFGSINGRAITAAELDQARTEARLNFLFSAGRWPEEDETRRALFDPDRQGRERIFLEEKLKDLNIQADDAAGAEWISHAFRDGKGGPFQLESYQKFVKTTLPHGRVSEEAFQRFVRHQAGIEQLFSVAGLSGGLITPREAESLYREENEQLSTEVVVFQASNYLAGVQLTPAGLAQYYTNHMAEYRIPEKVQVSYVKFEVTNFLAQADQMLAQVTNLTQQLEAFYLQRGADSFKDSDGKTLAHDAALQKIKEDQRQASAMNAASKKAAEFMEQLYDLIQKQPKQPDNLEKLAAATGYQSAVTEPFGSRDLPKDLKVFESFTRAAFALTPEEPMSTEPIPGDEAVFVIALKRKVPSEVPPLDAVREKATADFRQREAMDAARQAGQGVYRTLTNGFAQNKSFQAICLESQVISQKVPPFALSTQSLPGEWEERIGAGMLKRVAARLTPGGTSRFELTRDGGLIVHLLSRQPVDEAKLKTELPAFLSDLRQERQREAVSEWFNKEAELARFTDSPSRNKAGSR